MSLTYKVYILFGVSLRYKNEPIFVMSPQDNISIQYIVRSVKKKQSFNNFTMNRFENFCRVYSQANLLVTICNGHDIKK